MSDGAGTWCLIESDPGVFSELIREFGVTGLQVEELWSLDAEHFDRLKPVHGLIFLFKWIGPSSAEEVKGSVVQDSRLEKIFFAKQVIQNACATQAIISILMNCEDAGMELGPVLGEFKEFTKSFDPAMKGLALSNQDVIRSVHNSFSRQNVFEFDQKSASKDEDVYHFVTYIPIEGRLYELDGLKDGPIDHGVIHEGKDWTEVVRPVLQDRINKYSEGEIHFNLLAVISDRKGMYERQLTELEARGAQTTEVIRLRELIEEEQVKRNRYRLENVRRKHNYLPLIVQFLKELASHNQLLPLLEKAKEKERLRAEQKKAAKS
jgi:ubiquitin carboxyl-terminal hydrolase L5